MGSGGVSGPGGTGGASAAGGAGGSSSGGGAGTGSVSGAGGGAGSGGGACVKLGYDCASQPCCAGEGTCDPTGTKCSNGLGGYCDPSKVNPDAYCAFGYVCDTAASKCVKLTCISAQQQGVCTLLSDLKCCDPVTVCKKDADAGTEGCCAEDGTIVPQAEAWKCCSAGSTDMGDGTVQCAPYKPLP